MFSINSSNSKKGDLLLARGALLSAHCSLI
jgi:hypothetical protein